MPNSVLHELEIRIDRLKKYENNLVSDEERRCVEGRRMELESLLNYVSGKVDRTELTDINNKHEFWRLVDEF